MLRHVVLLQTLSIAAPIALREKQRVVGIIGSGMAGASTAHFLRELRPDLRVVVWERDAIVGGRARTADLGGRRVDLGATAISTLNQYLLSFTAGMRRANGNGSSTLGIYDGAGFRFRSREGALPLAAHLTARYGPSWLKVLPMVKATASNLSRIYDLQRRGVAFRTPASLLGALGLYELTQVSAYEYLHSLPRAFVEEFIDGASRDNYGQDGSLNAFADLVSLAGAGLAGDVFSLEGGTAQIPQSFLASSGAEVRLRTRVDAARLRPGNYYAVVDSTGRETRVDALVVATPIEFTNMSLPPDVRYRPRPYQATCVALAAGRLSRRVFGPRAGELDTVLTVDPADVRFSCVGAHGAVAGGDPIYKVMSRQRLSDAELDTYVFERRSSTVVRRTGTPPVPTRNWIPRPGVPGRRSCSASVFFTPTWNRPCPAWRLKLLPRRTSRCSSRRRCLRRYVLCVTEAFL
jgi:glycine/D-amino acid oxidase-like deaminating enzyme